MNNKKIKLRKLFYLKSIMVINYLEFLVKSFKYFMVRFVEY